MAELGPPRKKPVWVWVILGWQVYSLLSVFYSLALLYSGLVQLPSGYQGTLNPPSLGQLGLTAVVCALNLAGAIYLAMLRRLAVWLFASALVVQLVSLFANGLHLPIKGPLMFPILVASLAIGYGISLLILWYSWRLARTHVLA